MGGFKTPNEIDVKIGNETPEVKPVIKSNVEHIREFSNIPERYKSAKFEAKTKDQEKLVNAIRSNISGKRIEDVSDMLIIGTVGTGKTHVAIGAINSLIEREVYCRYVTEYDLLETYFRKDYTKFDGFKQAKFLVIDEVGKRELLDWQKIQIEELISHRYNEMLPTIFITNLNTDEFKAFVGDRVSDRLRDNKVVRVILDGDSLRGTNENNKKENK